MKVALYRKGDLVEQKSIWKEGSDCPYRIWSDELHVLAYELMRVWLSLLWERIEFLKCLKWHKMYLVGMERIFTDLIENCLATERVIKWCEVERTHDKRAWGNIGRMDKIWLRIVIAAETVVKLRNVERTRDKIGRMERLLTDLNENCPWCGDDCWKRRNVRKY